MARFRNDTPGARAVLLKDRSYVLIEAGETKDVPDDMVDLWAGDLVLDGTPAVDPDRTDARRAMLEALGDDELRAFVEQVTGRKPHPRAGRQKLIEAALGEPVPEPDPLDHDGDGRKGGSLPGPESTAAKGAARKRGGPSGRPENG